MLQDVEFFRSRISKLEGAAGLGEYLVKVVERKGVTDSSADTDHKPDGDTIVTKTPENAAEKT